MNRETGPTLSPQDKSARLTRQIGKREKSYREAGLGQVQVGFPLEKIFKKGDIREKVILSADEVTDKVGNVKANIKKSIKKLRKELGKIDPLRQQQIQLAKTSELLVEGLITEKMFARQLAKFNKFVSETEDNSNSKEAIELIIQRRQEAQKSKRDKAIARASISEIVFTAPSPNGHQTTRQPEPETVIPSDGEIKDPRPTKKYTKDTYELPNGDVVTSRIARFFKFFDVTSEENQFITTYILETHYRGVDKKTARKRFSIELAEARRQGRRGGLDIINSKVPIKGSKIIEGSYYLRTVQPVNELAREVHADQAALPPTTEAHALNTPIVVLPAEPKIPQVDIKKKTQAQPAAKPETLFQKVVNRFERKTYRYSNSPSSSEVVQSQVSQRVIVDHARSEETTGSVRPIERVQPQSQDQEQWWNNMPSLTQTEIDCLEAHRKSSGDFDKAVKVLNNSLTEKQIKQFINSAYSRRRLFLNEDNLAKRAAYISSTNNNS